MKNVSHEELIKMDPMDFVNFLENEFNCLVPTNIESAEEARKCGMLLAVLSNQYTYLIDLLSYIKTAHREAKKNKAYLGDLIDKRDAVANKASAVKLQYQAVSRLYTIRKDILEELKMTDYRVCQ